MIKKYIENFKRSKTVRAAFYKKVAGVLTVILANFGYFEGTLSPTTFAITTGVITTLIGIYDYYIRTQTTQALEDK